MSKKIFVLLLPVLLGGLLSLPAYAQRERGERGMTCEGNWNGDRASHCAIKEFTVAATGNAITVDGRQNGGVSVKGWDKAEIFVRARVQTWANTDAEAQALAGQVSIETSGGNINANGPTLSGRQGWAVSFEVFVPRNSDLNLKAHNGGVSISEVRGRQQFETVNGGVTLRRLAGAVRGHTINGGVTVDLDGSRWEGESLDVKTTNGGVVLNLPEGYAAHLETSTVNGGVRIDFPITVQGKIDKNLVTDLGGGGPLVRAVTTNGGVVIRKKGAAQ